MKGDIIPNGEYLYRYVNPAALPEDQIEIPYGIFQDQSKSLSCDWAAYQVEPENSIHIKEGKNVIVRIQVCEEIRNPYNPKQPKQLQPAWHQKIEHDPIDIGEDIFHPEIANSSHSLISGLKKAPIAKAIAENSIIYRRVRIEELTDANSLMHPEEESETSNRFSAAENGSKQNQSFESATMHDGLKDQHRNPYNPRPSLHASSTDGFLLGLIIAFIVVFLLIIVILFVA